MGIPDYLPKLAQREILELLEYEKRYWSAQFILLESDLSEESLYRALAKLKRAGILESVEIRGRRGNQTAYRMKRD